MSRCHCGGVATVVVVVVVFHVVVDVGVVVVVVIFVVVVVVVVVVVIIVAVVVRSRLAIYLSNAETWIILKALKFTCSVLNFVKSQIVLPYAR